MCQTQGGRIDMAMWGTHRRRLEGVRLTLAGVLAAAMVSCGGERVTEGRSGVETSQLAGTDYALAVLDAEDGLVLLGRLTFEAIDGEQVRGGWRLETWGEQPDFDGLPVNRGAVFPEDADLGAFTGQIFGDWVIVRIALPRAGDSLGLVFQEQDGEELLGTATLLPSGLFKGRVRGLRAGSVLDRD